MQKRLDVEFSAEVIKALTPENWKALLGTIELRLARQEAREPTLNKAMADLAAVGLDRINEVLTPAIVSVNQMVELGFLVAHSSSAHVLDAEASPVWFIDAGVQRDLFRPSPFLIVQATDDVDTWAVVRNANYIRENGALQGEIVEVGPDADTETEFASWSIGALAGSTLAQMVLLARAEERAAEVAADKIAVAADRVATAADRVQTGLDRVATGQDRVAVAADKGLVAGHKAAAQDAAAAAIAAAASIVGGPVASWSGLTGVISASAARAALALEIAHIAGLQAALDDVPSTGKIVGLAYGDGLGY